MLAGVVAVLCSDAVAHACDEFRRVDNAQIKVLLERVKDPAVPELDRGFAFDALICDDRPHVRQEAMRQALAAVGSPMLRAQVLAQILYQAKSLRMELQDAPGLDEKTRQFIRDNRGVIAFNLQKADPSIGCIRLDTSSGGCSSYWRLLIQGTKIDIRFAPQTDGSLELREDGVLIGYFRPREGGGLIPARIALF
ncbi:hypothetical protein V5F44_06380 [Xanthobacter sp. V2C-8]|uniref:hypothetical protein n=1 Tax=Xanthobacter albus TaxID=3119929 RepID=UPI003729CEB0